MSHEARKETMPEHSQPSPNEAPASLALGSCSGVWKVTVRVCGADAGAYEYPTRAAAVADMEERRRKWGVLGCFYRLEAPGNLCRECGQPGHYVRTRYFENSAEDVWECLTPGCENEGLIFHRPNAGDEARRQKTESP